MKLTSSGHGLKMHKIEKTSYGLRVTLTGSFTQVSWSAFITDLTGSLDKLNPPFNVLADLRELIPPSTEMLEELIYGQQLYASRGLQRSAVVMSSPIVKGQFRQVAFSSGIVGGERYIDSTKSEDWEDICIEWLVNAVEPTEITLTLSSTT
jgi:L-ribulose-5-phosphate 3-epimerase UlaE